MKAINDDPSVPSRASPLRRFTLTMPSPNRRPVPVDLADIRRSSVGHDQSSTPPRPSYSPVTPTISHANLNTLGNAATHPVEWMEEPEPLPVSLEENPDATALRSAISILQLQRQQALRDIRDLDKMKGTALKNPQKFVQDLKEGKLTKSSPRGLVNLDDSDEEDMTDAASTKKSNPAESVFGKLPNPQNIVRCPPVNWDKYHVVGESLEKLHEEQRRLVASGDLSTNLSGQQTPHVIAAPYRPFVDKIEPPTTELARNGHAK